MSSINTYLNFNGNCEEAFNFYKSVFGGEFAFIGKYKDMPENPASPISEDNKEKIMHASLPIGENSILMGSDTGGEWASNFIQGNNFAISINTKNKNEADRLFSNLSVDGKITMPINKTFWDSYFGMFTDKFGINWMVSFDESTKNK